MHLTRQLNEPNDIFGAYICIYEAQLIVDKTQESVAYNSLKEFLPSTSS